MPTASADGPARDLPAAAVPNSGTGARDLRQAFCSNVGAASPLPRRSPYRWSFGQRLGVGSAAARADIGAVSRAFDILSDHLETRIQGRAPVEIGPKSIATAFILAAGLGVSTLDADIVGGARPQRYSLRRTLCTTFREPRLPLRTNGEKSSFYGTESRLSRRGDFCAILRSGRGGQAYVARYPLSHAIIERAVGLEVEVVGGSCRPAVANDGRAGASQPPHFWVRYTCSTLKLMRMTHCSKKKDRSLGSQRKSFSRIRQYLSCFRAMTKSGKRKRSFDCSASSIERIASLLPGIR